MSLSRRSKDDVFSYVPAGTVLPFAGATAPEGWALCNGETINRADYAQLYMAIGDAWGNGDGSTTFHLPDLRGKFMRGTDTMGLAAGVDPEAGGRTPSNAGGNSGDNVGTVQGEATKKNGLTASTSSSSGGISANHYHRNPINIYTSGQNFSWINLNGGVSTGSGSGVTYASSGARQTPNTGNVSSDHSHGISSSTTINQGDQETRPVNANMNYIIKL